MHQHYFLTHELLYAFSATLEETMDADVLLVVVDASDEHKYEQIDVVMEELKNQQVDLNKVILVYNKIDKINKDELNELKSYPFNTCNIVARTGKNVAVLKQMIKEKLVK